MSITDEQTWGVTSFRLTGREREHLSNMSAANGMTRGAFLRFLILDYYVQNKTAVDGIAKARASTARKLKK